MSNNIHERKAATPGKIDVSFVIPALNEEANIAQAIESIRSNMAGLDLSYDMVVVDNGSIDDTAEVARKLGALVVIKSKTTISALRNLGVKNTKGDIIVFVDADVYLKEEWNEVFLGVYESMLKDPMVLTGSTYVLREAPSWVEKSWYEPVLRRAPSNYINGGHLIISRKSFVEINGFNEKLETGEDYELCQRARKHGMEVINDRKLCAVHKGYPVTMRDFFSRERWHGKGDFQSWRSFLSSKPAILACINAFFAIASVIVAILMKDIYLIVPYICFVAVVCSSSAFFRCREISTGFFKCIMLYYIYFNARGLSCLDVFLGRIKTDRGNVML